MNDLVRVVRELREICEKLCNLYGTILPDPNTPEWAADQLDEIAGRLERYAATKAEGAQAPVAWQEPLLELAAEMRKSHMPGAQIAGRRLQTLVEKLVGA